MDVLENNTSKQNLFPNEVVPQVDVSCSMAGNRISSNLNCRLRVTNSERKNLRNVQVICNVD